MWVKGSKSKKPLIASETPLMTTDDPGENVYVTELPTTTAVPVTAVAAAVPNPPVIATLVKDKSLAYPIVRLPIVPLAMNVSGGTGNRSPVNGTA
jgi:hypothetical protein